MQCDRAGIGSLVCLNPGPELRTTSVGSLYGRHFPCSVRSFPGDWDEEQTWFSICTSILCLGAWSVETSARCTLLRLCGSKLGVFHTNSYQRVLSKSSVPLSSGFLHSSIHQILMECPVWRPCSKCLGSLSEDLVAMEVGVENSRGEGSRIVLSLLEIHEATQVHRRPFLHHPSQAHGGLETSCSFGWDWRDGRFKRRLASSF